MDAFSSLKQQLSSRTHTTHTQATGTRARSIPRAAALTTSSGARLGEPHAAAHGTWETPERRPSAHFAARPPSPAFFRLPLRSGARPRPDREPPQHLAVPPRKPPPLLLAEGAPFGGGSPVAGALQSLRGSGLASEEVPHSTPRKRAHRQSQNTTRAVRRPSQKQGPPPRLSADGRPPRAVRTQAYPGLGGSVTLWPPPIPALPPAGATRTVQPALENSSGGAIPLLQGGANGTRAGAGARAGARAPSRAPSRALGGGGGDGDWSGGEGGGSDTSGGALGNSSSLRGVDSSRVEQALQLVEHLRSKLKFGASPPPASGGNGSGSGSGSGAADAQTTAPGATAAGGAPLGRVGTAVGTKGGLPYWGGATWDEVRVQLGPEYYEGGRLCSLITDETIVRGHGPIPCRCSASSADSMLGQFPAFATTGRQRCHL